MVLQTNGDYYKHNGFEEKAEYKPVPEDFLFLVFLYDEYLFRRWSLSVNRW